MTYRPRFVGQIDGTEYQYEDCLAAAGAMHLDRDTRGSRITTAATVRALTGDRYGGLNLSQVDYALRLIDPSRDHMDVRAKLAQTTALHMLDAGQGMSLIVNYGVIVDAGWNGNQSGTFRGGHGYFVNERRPAGTGHELLVYDPLLDRRRSNIPQAPVWMPQGVVLRAAGAYAGAGYVQAGFTRDTEPNYKVTIAKGKFARYLVSGAAITGRSMHSTSFDYGPVPCSAPRWCSWPGHAGRSLVQILRPGSAYNGWFVNSAGLNIVLRRA